MDYEGKLIRGENVEEDGKVYLIQNGKKRWIISPEVFEALKFRWEDIVKVSSSVLSKFVEGEPISTTKPDRYQLSASYLRGKGIEIGAGAFPSTLPSGVYCENYDIRNEEELAALFRVKTNQINKTYSLASFPERFPNKADFVIAHNVLEHSSNPIKTLIEWNSFLNESGHIIISVPHSDFCPDRGRLVPTIKHLIYDFLFDRNDNAFESREHIYSFLTGWIDDGGLKGLNKFEVAKNAHNCAQKDKNDLHWHAFTEELLLETIKAAAYFSRKTERVKLLASPLSEDKGKRTAQDIVAIYNISGDKNNYYNNPAILDKIAEVRQEILNALQVIKVAEV